MGGIPKIQAGNPVMQGQATLAARRALLLTVLVLGLLTGCASLGLHQATPGSATVQKATAEIPEAQLLDVWIALFDPGELPKDEDDAMGLSLDIREAEARFMPVHLRNTLEKTGYWGAVRVVPSGVKSGELLVSGTILQSNGLQLDLEITARDASGHQWFTREYRDGVEAAGGRALPTVVDVRDEANVQEQCACRTAVPALFSHNFIQLTGLADVKSTSCERERMAQSV